MKVFSDRKWILQLPSEKKEDHFHGQSVNLDDWPPGARGNVFPTPSRRSCRYRRVGRECRSDATGAPFPAWNEWWVCIAEAI